MRMAKPAEDRSGRANARQELLVTVLLVVAAVGTSWSSYQAARWHGAQAMATSRTSAIRIEAARAAGLGQDQTQVDVATFIAWVDADRRGDSRLATFYVDRFRAEFKPAFEAWRATRPLVSPNAPPTPFVMDEYRVAAKQEAQRLDAEAEASALVVNAAIERAGNYVLTVVLYAVVLFFAGMSTKINNGRLRWTMMVAGYVVLLSTLVWIATLPRIVSV
jgi:hypothetical protein